MESKENQENELYLQNQLITYIGNKRALLDFIGQEVKVVQEKLGKEKLECLDIFSGSGIVSRYLKQFSSSITTNDLEAYSCIINRCYLSDLDEKQLEDLRDLYKKLNEKIDERMRELERAREENRYVEPGFISKYYAPKDIDDITKLSLVEKHLISPEFAYNKSETGAIVINDEENICIMIKRILNNFTFH